MRNKIASVLFLAGMWAMGAQAAEITGKPVQLNGEKAYLWEALTNSDTAAPLYIPSGDYIAFMSGSIGTSAFELKYDGADAVTNTVGMQSVDNDDAPNGFNFDSGSGLFVGFTTGSGYYAPIFSSTGLEAQDIDLYIQPVEKEIR